MKCKTSQPLGFLSGSTPSTQRFLGAWREEGAALQAAVNFLDAVFGLFDATYETLLLAG